MAHAPSYPRMMRAVEKQLHTLPATLLCQLARAIVPLGRAAACSRLLPRLVTALSHSSPPPSFDELLQTGRELCRRVPMTEALLFELHTAVIAECSSEGEGALGGTLTPQQICLALWVFARHLPLIAQQAPMSPLGNMLREGVELLLQLLGDLSILSSAQARDSLRPSSLSSAPRSLPLSSPHSPHPSPVPANSSATCCTSSSASEARATPTRWAVPSRNWKCASSATSSA